MRIAKDQNKSSLPDNMSINNKTINNKELPTEFAKFFLNKIKSITENVPVIPTVYNGNSKVTYPNSFFMDENDIIESLQNIKTKNCEGFDRIPQRILVDGAPVLITPLKDLFWRINFQNKLPDQWLISKITPVPKKVLKTKLKILGL